MLDSSLLSRESSALSGATVLGGVAAEIVQGMEGIVDGPAFVITGIVAELVKSGAQSLLSFLDQYRVGGRIKLEESRPIELSPVYWGLRVYVGVHEFPLAPWVVLLGQPSTDTMVEGIRRTRLYSRIAVLESATLRHCGVFDP